jgi:glycine/D-amino acid oxidase-like deaminating enzyme
MLTRPFWTDTAPRPSDLVTALLPERADVAVIGSGYTGLHAARTLAQAGANVVVLEQHTIGWGASSRNGGMLNPGLKQSAPTLFSRYGAELGCRLWHWSLEAIDFVERTIKDEQIDCDFCRTGQVVLAYKPSHMAALRHEVAWHAKHLADSAPEVIEAGELHSEIGSASYFGGLRDPRAAALQPAKYTVGLAAAAARAGAILVEHAEVQGLTRASNGSGRCYRLTTSQGLLHATEVLLATNGYTTGLVPAARRGIFSGGSYIITTEPLPLELRQLLSPRGRMFYDSKHFLNYFRLTPDGRMLFGGRHDLSTDLDLKQSALALRARMLQVFPDLAPFAITHSWTGRLGLTFDLMPHAGRLQVGPVPGVLYAYGYGGHGIAIASYLGHSIGHWIAGAPSGPDDPIRDLPHHRYFFTPYERLYLPLVSAWFRFLDWLS